MRFVAVVWTATAGPPPRRFWPALVSLHPAIPAQTIASAELVRILYVTAMARPPR